jgi:palmitoyltransferase
MGRCKVGSIGTDFTCRHWLSLDPCGLFCLSLSYTLHLFALIGAGQTLISYHVLAQCLYVIFYIPASLLALWSLTMATTTNPGAVPMGARPLQSNLDTGENNGTVIERDPNRGGLHRRRGVRRCRKCNDNYKPCRAHHDSVTGRCIVKMDHFCPWVGNAIGIRNHKVSVSFSIFVNHKEE